MEKKKKKRDSQTDIREERENREEEEDIAVWFGLVYLFNGVATPYGLSNAKHLIDLEIFDYDTREDKSKIIERRKKKIDLERFVFVHLFNGIPTLMENLMLKFDLLVLL